MGSVMIKTTMVDVILMVATAVAKMLIKTFAPYVNALKKKLHYQIVNTNIIVHILIASYYTTFYISCWLLF